MSGREKSDPLEFLPVGAAGEVAVADLQGVQGIAASEAAGATTGIDALAQALRTQAIEPAAAQLELIREVVAKTLGPDASVQATAELFETVRSLLEDDPTWNSLVQPN